MECYFRKYWTLLVLQVSVICKFFDLLLLWSRALCYVKNNEEVPMIYTTCIYNHTPKTCMETFLFVFWYHPTLLTATNISSIFGVASFSWCNCTNYSQVLMYGKLETKLAQGWNLLEVWLWVLRLQCFIMFGACYWLYLEYTLPKLHLWQSTFMKATVETEIKYIIPYQIPRDALPHSL